MRQLPLVWSIALLALQFAGAQGRSVEWTHYGGNAASHKYSPLDQINKDNVGKLTVAWRWASPDNAVVEANPTARPGGYADTPLMVKGVLYTVTSLGQIAAINPATGQTIWSVDPGNWKTGRPGNLGYVHRGIAYWTDSKVERLLLGTHDAYLISVDAKTGKLDPAFGEGGRIDLMGSLAHAVRATNYSVSAAPVISKDVVVVGASIHDGPTHKEWPRGDVSGFDVRTGKRLWTIHSIPQKGEFGNETWGDDSWTYTGSTNVWTNMSTDDELGYVYLPFGTPTDDFYGGHRPGANLFAETLMAVDVKSGKRVWHFQGVHHGIWDYDFPAAPILIDISVNGKPVRAVAQVSKQGFTYVLDRRTGAPVWPIEERAVPQSTVPGERTHATQPFPTKPPAYERQGVTEADLIDFTPELKAAALEVFKQFETGPIFTPPSEKGTIVNPGWAGGANWAGASFDPETGTLYVPSMTSPIVVQLVKPNPERSNLLYARGGTQMPPTLDGLPLLKPPYGRITALDLNKGDMKWQVAVGDGPRNHPLLKDLSLPALGAPIRNAAMVTRTLLFVAMGAGNLGGGRNLPVGGRPLSKPEIEPTKFRVYDKATGAPLWDMEAPARPLASPMTYMYQGKQYIVVAGGGGLNAELIAFALGSLGLGTWGLKSMRNQLVLVVGLLARWPVGLLVVGLLASWPLGLSAQALPNINSLSVRYNSLKTAAKADGELKAQLDEIDKVIAEARRSGNIGEVRRQIAKGMVLLDKGTWTPQLDYRNSLALRSERTVIDSASPYTLRIEQIYRPAIDLSAGLTTTIRIRKRVPAARAGAPAVPPPVSRELGTFDGVSRDLRETPFAVELNLAAVEDGAQVIEAEVFDGTTPLGAATLNVFLHKGLDAKLKTLDAAAATATAAVRADVLFPADYIKNVNRGRIELQDFNVGVEIAKAEAIVAEARGGKDPFKGKGGDFERHYVLEGANEIMPYRVYVPKSYAASKATPLVIALHGLGGNEDGFFDNYEKLPPQLAEKHGFLLAAPLGFRRDGFYGSSIMGTGDAASRRRAEYSEKDVLEVLRLMKAAYNVDESRIYLIGHSMGAIGTWALGAKYSQTWAALVAFAGVGAGSLAENLKALPHFIVHGDADNTVNVSGSRNMVAALKKLNANVTYIEVPGGSHTDIVVPNLPAAFEFLAAQRKGATVVTKQ